MNHTVRLWRPSMARVGVLTVAIAIAPLPVAAGETGAAPSKPAPTLRTSVEKVVATQSLEVTKTAARAQQSGSSTDLGSSAFFKTPAGIAVLAALAAGIGYTLYSTSNDRVKSPARE